MLPENENMDLHLKTPFAEAPYVHPLNAPRYQAQLLRATNFAKSTGQRLLWTEARDEPVTTDDIPAHDECQDAQKQKWR